MFSPKILLASSLILGACARQEQAALRPGLAPPSQSQSGEGTKSERRARALASFNFDSDTAVVVDLLANSGLERIRESALFEFQHNRYIPALEQAGRWVRMAPESAAAWTLLSRALVASRMEKQGLAAARAALALEPQHPDLAFRVAEILGRLGRWEASEAALEIVLELDPTHGPAAGSLARLMTLTGRLESARVHARSAVAAGEPLPAILLQRLGLEHRGDR